MWRREEREGEMMRQTGKKGRDEKRESRGKLV